MSANPPAGVITWTPEVGHKGARTNVMVEVFGQSKSGKTHLIVRCARPLYVLHLDPNDNLDVHLLKAGDDFPGEVHVVKVPPVRYSMLTEEEAKRRIAMAWEFADWARSEAREHAAKGEPTGTFIIDGGTKFKGYFEKALLGESATLGWRAKKGERGGPSTIEYAASNAALNDFITSFVGTPLDFAITYEGRRIWAETRDPDTNRKKSTPTENFRSSSPESTAFGMKAQVETLKAREKVQTAPGEHVTVIVPKIKLGWNAYGIHLEDRTMNAKTFAELKELLLGDLPAEEVLDKPGVELDIVDSDPFPEVEGEE